jgi:hypothetical protein
LPLYTFFPSGPKTGSQSRRGLENYLQIEADEPIAALAATEWPLHQDGNEGGHCKYHLNAKAQRRKEENLNFVSLRLCAFALRASLQEEESAKKLMHPDVSSTDVKKCFGCVDQRSLAFLSPRIIFLLPFWYFGKGVLT